MTLSHQGYVKYQPLSEYEAQRRGGKGKSAARIKEEDFIDRLLVANTHDHILCFSSRGRVYSMKFISCRKPLVARAASDRQPAAAGAGRTYHCDPASDRV